MAQTFVELADTLVADFDLMEFLHTLADRCVELLDVDAAGLLLADGRGMLRLVAALNRAGPDRGTVPDPERRGALPGLLPHRAGRRRQRYSRRRDRQAVAAVRPAAREMGFAGVHAIPMRLRDQVIGTLNLFRSEPDGLDPAVARAARALVDVATIGILQERAVRQQELVAGQLQAALNSRVMIEQAKGILAERLQTTPDEAFVLLRRYARDHNRPLTALVGDVIQGAADITRGGGRAQKPSREARET